MNTYETYLAGARERQLADLFAYLRIPSISTLPEHAADVRRCADWLRAYLASIGLRNACLLETDGNPIVYADWLEAGESAPVLLLYGHYDIQPAEPLQPWTTPPFEPSLRDDAIYARGATDNKGTLFVYLRALEAILAVDGRLPCNIKLIVEGEEELRADNLDAFLTHNVTRLACDACVISDSALYARGVPSLAVALRGMAALQLRVDTAQADLHSGLYGGPVPNALHALSRLLATLHNDEGRVSVGGFYDGVIPVSPSEAAEWSELGFDDDVFRREIGATRLVGGPEHSVLERMWSQPTLDLHGIWGGFMGDGIKTVIPCEAHAKLSCRLVADQEPDRILALVVAHLERHCPSEAQLTVEWTLPGAAPMTIPRDGPLLAAARNALRCSYDGPVRFFRSGASVPVAALVKERLKVDSLMLGFGLPGDGAHAVDEHLEIDSFDRGARTMVEFFLNVAGKS